MKKMYDYAGKTCVVTGGAGFIGQNIVKQLITDKAEVIVIDNFSYNASRANVHDEASIIEGDIRDEKVFGKISKKIDYFFHFAAPSSITLFKKDLRECVDVTIHGFMNAISFCSKNNARLIYPSSGSVYAGTPIPQAESSEIKYVALNHYAKAKLALEYVQKAYGDTCNSLGVRIFAGYGPSEAHKGDFASVIYIFCKQILNGQSPVIFGDGKQKRDFVYIDDLMESILTLGQNCQEPIVNIGSGKNVSFNEIVRIINNIAKKDIKAEYVKKPGVYLEETLADVKLIGGFYRNTKNTSVVEGIGKIVQSLEGK